MPGVVQQTLDFTVYYDKASEVVFPTVSSNLAPSNPAKLASQNINVSATLRSSIEDSKSIGLGEVLIQKVTNVDQQGNTYAQWQYSFAFNNDNFALGPGLLVMTTPILNGVSWPNPSSTSSNPTEITSSGQATIPGLITFGTGPYFSATGKATKVKYDSSPYRRINIELTVFNPADN